MEAEKDQTVPESPADSTSLPKVFNRLVEIPLVKSLYGQVTSVYGRTRDKNFVTKLGFGAAEMSVKAAFVTTKLTYTALPPSLKEGLEEKVSRVDSLACDGLDYLQTKWPVINKDTEKIIAAGADQVEQSDLVEVFLTVTEAAVDYVKPSKKELEQEPEKEPEATPPAVQTKADRIRGVTSTVVDEGVKILWYAVAVPGKVTQAGIDSAKTAAYWSWDQTQNLLDKLPVIGGILTTFLGCSRKDEFLFSPPILGEGESLNREFLWKKQDLRRSKRFKAKGDYHRIVDASEPFPNSPERKRKHGEEGGEGSLIEELIQTNDDYVSEDDPDYVPEEDEDEESGSSDAEGNDDGKADPKKDESKPKKDETKPKKDETKPKKTEPEAKKAESKTKLHDKPNGDVGKHGDKPSLVPNGVGKIEKPVKPVTSVKEGSAGAAHAQKGKVVENVGSKADSTTKGSANKTEGRIVV